MFFFSILVLLLALVKIFGVSRMRDFLEDIFLTMLTLGVLPFKKNSFYIDIKKKSFITLYLKCIPLLNTYFDQIYKILWKKSWNDKKKKSKFFMYLNKKIMKHLAKRSFIVFNGPPTNTIEHTKTFCFIIFLLKEEKNVFLIILRVFFNKI